MPPRIFRYNAQTAQYEERPLTPSGKAPLASRTGFDGRSGGQTQVGGTAAGEDLTLQSTAHATRGLVKAVDPVQVTADMTTAVGTISAVASSGTNQGAGLHLQGRTSGGVAVDWTLVASKTGPAVLRAGIGEGALDGSDDVLRADSSTGLEIRVGGLTIPSQAKGDLLAAPASGPMTRLAAGTNGHVLTADSTQTLGVKWAAGGGASLGGDVSTYAKGSILVGTGSGTAALRAVGSNGYVMIADSTQSDGVKWGPAPTPANYFGTGADGSVTISADTTWETTTAVDDTGYIEKNFVNLTIDSGKTVRPAHRCRVTVVYCTGNLTVNGTLSVSSAAATPTVGLSVTRAAAVDAALPHEGNSTTYTLVSAAGASGGSTRNSGTVSAGNAGSNASQGQTGGGGSGAGGVSGGGAIGNGGAGSAGTAYGGGSGGGGGGYNQQSAAGVNGSAAASNQGAGGNGATNVDATFTIHMASGGGAGNPVGTGNAQSPATVTAPGGGGGGVLLIVVGGDVSIGSAGVISADGGNGGNANGNSAAVSRAMGGGGAGGGRILLLYAGTITSIASTTTSQVSFTGGGVLRALGGAGGTATGGTLSNSAGGAGGDGSVQIAQISA